MHNLVKDPIGEVNKIYNQFGYSFTESFKERMIKYIQENPKDKYGSHIYTLNDYGLTEDIVNAHFKDYIEFLKQLK